MQSHLLISDWADLGSSRFWDMSGDWHPSSQQWRAVDRVEHNGRAMVGTVQNQCGTGGSLVQTEVLLTEPHSSGKELSPSPLEGNEDAASTSESGDASKKEHLDQSSTR